MFLLQIPGEATVYEYESHTGNRVNGCSLKALIEDVTVLVEIVMVITFPVYVWLVYSILRRCIPKTFIRIWIGEVLLLLGLAAMFFIDLSGHVIYHNRYNQSAECMFPHSGGNYTNLDLPWAVNIFPVFLTSMGIILVVTTTFEFISAQSPRSMKGLLIGVFFAIRAIFNFLGTAIVFPFSLTRTWTVDDKIISCGFGYYLCNCLIGVGGLVLFSIAAKQYRYRERDDPPFNQMLIERVWANS